MLYGPLQTHSPQVWLQLLGCCLVPWQAPRLRTRALLTNPIEGSVAEINSLVPHAAVDLSSTAFNSVCR